MSDNIPFEIQMEIIEKVSGVKSLVRFRYICLVDDDNNETFKVHQQEFAPFVRSPLLKQSNVYNIVGACHGLLCLYGFHNWSDYGFGNVIPSSNLPHESIRLHMNTQVVIDRFIYWGAREKTINDDGKYTTNHMVVSFDLITKEFKVVELQHSLTNELLYGCVCVSKLRESLVVYGSIYVDRAECCDVWVMERHSSFKKLFTVGAPVYYILGFRKSGEPILETVKELGESSVHVYDPSSEQIKNLEIYGEKGLYFMGSYKESLLLLDHSDSRIYYYNN
ncbi:hypothetical protein Tco_0930562 [Tanacetum coccineum]